MEITREGTIMIMPDGEVRPTGFRATRVKNPGEFYREIRRRVHAAANRVHEDCAEIARGNRPGMNNVIEIE